MVGLLSCLLSPVAWTHHYVYLLPLLALLLRERRYVWTALLSYQWAFDWAERESGHLGQGGVSGALWQLLGDEFAISATVVVLAYAVAELRAVRRASVGSPAAAPGVRVPVRT
jgi:alpha-1,2-mannosyltransferase